MSLASDLGDRFKAEFAGKIIAIVSAGLLTVVLARLLEPDEYGLLFLAISVLGMAELFSKLGIAKSAARYVAEYKETDPEQLAHILGFAFIFNLGTTVIVCLILFIANEFVATVVGEPEIGPLLAIGVFYVAFHTLEQFARAGLQGFEAIKPASALIAIEGSSRLVFAVGFVVLGYGVVGALVGYILSFGITALIGLRHLYTRFYQTAPTGDIETGIRKRIAAYTAPLTLTSTANVIDKKVDTILVGALAGPVAVAYYTVGKQVIQFVNTPIAALGFTLSPTYEAQKSKGNSETAARIYEEALTHGLLLYIPAAAGLALVARPLVELVFGDEYLGAVVVLQVLAVYVVLLSMMELTSNGLDFLGRARERAIIKGVSAVLNVGLNILLIPMFGAVGAAIATVGTFALYTVGSMYIMHSELNLRIRYIVRHIGAVLVVAGVMSAAVYILLGLVEGFVTLAAVVGAGAIIWALLATSVGLLDIKRVLAVLS